LLAALAFLFAATVYADEEEKREKPAEKKGTYTIELVSADETGEIIDEFALLQEEAIVELSARHRQKIGMSASPITVITRDDIEASGAANFSDLLRMVPGMNVMLSTPLHSSVSARLNWTGENNHFLALIDGREVNLELLGQPLWALQPISLDDIERIEIIRGPGSFLYGANALAGVVAITTRAIGEKNSGWAHLGGGEVGRVKAGARASVRHGDWGASLSGGVDITGRFYNPRKPGRDIWKLRAVGEYRLSKKARLLLDGGFTGGQGLIASGVGPMDVIIDVRSLRLAYESEDLKGHLYWTQMTGSVNTKAPLEFAGIHLAEIMPFDFDGHTFDLEGQWTLPTFFDPLLIIVGGGGRASWIGSDQLLDAETFGDVGSDKYHKPGISHWEGRVGAFVHAEFAPFDWVTVTGDLRIDYNTITEEFLSPRLAAVFLPFEDQYLRLGVTRAFRKPAIIETHTHLNVTFPEGGPITAASQDKFREFMTRGIGNHNLDNEKLLSFEAGYLGQFLEKKLSVSLDLYYNLYANRIGVDEEIEQDDTTGLPDLDTSTFYYKNRPSKDRLIIGWELMVRYSPSKKLSLLASWAFREEFKNKNKNSTGSSPKNFLIAGVRFRTDSGLVGSLYAFAHSEFTEKVASPSGLLEEGVNIHMANFALVLGKIGWQFRTAHDLQLEAGLKLFLPVSPDEAPYFRYNEAGGILTETGEPFTGDILRRMVSAYLQGSF
jgi:iron complex outermembrane receptor protein